jgi:hypothetical protein
MTINTWFMPVCQIVQIVFIFVFVFVLLRMVFVLDGVLDGVCAGLDCVFLVLSSPCIVCAGLVNLKYLV